MKSPIVITCAALTLAACYKDETLSGYGAADVTWHLQSIDGVQFSADARLNFPAEGEITGQAPCNGFSGEQNAPYPWFDAGSLAVTRRACADLPAEATFLDALQEMQLAEVQGDTLILSNEAGREMVFRAQSE